MDRKVILKLVGISVAFLMLGFGYFYFQEQSLLSSGKSSSDSIIQMIQDSDTDSIKAKLAEFVGGVDPEDNAAYFQALVSIDFVAGLVLNGEELEYTGGELGTAGDFTVFSGSYKIAAPQGGEDYLVIIMRREDGRWKLANTQLAATDPFLVE